MEISPSCNTEIICKYIIAEQNEINIKESTKEGKIKVLIDLIKFLDFKDLPDITKEDIFSYLNRFRKSEDDDLDHRWIGTWNNRHMVLLKFFRWFHDQDNPDIKNRKYPSGFSRKGVIIGCPILLKCRRWLLPSKVSFSSVPWGLSSL